MHRYSNLVTGISIHGEHVFIASPLWCFSVASSWKPQHFRIAEILRLDWSTNTYEYWNIWKEETADVCLMKCVCVCVQISYFSSQDCFNKPNYSSMISTWHLYNSRKKKVNIVWILTSHEKTCKTIMLLESFDGKKNVSHRIRFGRVYLAS